MAKNADLNKLVADLTEAFTEIYTDKVVRSQPHLFYYSDHLLTAISDRMLEEGKGAGSIRNAIEKSIKKHIEYATLKDNAADKKILKEIFEGDKTKFRRFLIKYTNGRGGAVFSSHRAARTWASKITVDGVKPFAGEEVHLGHVESAVSSRYRQSITHVLGDPYTGKKGSGLWEEHGTKLNIDNATQQLKQAYKFNETAAKAAATKLNKHLTKLLKIENSARFDKIYKEGNIHAELAVHAEVPEFAEANLSPEKSSQLSQFFKLVTKDILNIKASKTINDILDEVIDSALNSTPKVIKESSKIKGTKSKIKAPIIKVVKPPKPEIEKQRGQIEAQMSPIALQTLLNKAINEAIKVNMGKGAATKVLNYRTGRFAESVEIDAVAPRRDGAMVAFYNYMKNPYATFAPGGAQYAREPSRDPNKLIRKSMRQIAAAAAVTRFFPQEAS